MGLGIVLFLLASGCLRAKDPISPGERREIITQDRQQLFSQESLPDHPIGLFEAMARALKYNLDHKVAIMDLAIRQQNADLTRFSLLPQMTLNAGYSIRDNMEASSGMSLTDSKRSDAFSTSKDQKIRNADLTMLWNLLDFGMTAVQMDQDDDLARIADEKRRKAVHNLFQEVRSAFWRAAGAQKLKNLITPVKEAAFTALEDAKKVEEERLKPQLEILRFQRALMDIVRQLEGLQHELILARTQFAALVHLPPSFAFELDIPNDTALAITPVGMELEEMETLALLNRPESREKMYQNRIDQGEVKKAMLRLLPGLELTISKNYDSNSFSLNPQWEELGTRVVVNLLEIFKGPKSITLAENRQNFGHLQRLAMDMAILTQVHLAYQQYRDEVRKLKWSEDINAIDQRILRQVGANAKESAQTRLEYIHAAAGAIFSRLQLYQSYAEAQNAVGRIYVSIGVDLASSLSEHDNLNHLTQGLRKSTLEWNEAAASSPKPLSPLLRVYDPKHPEVCQEEPAPFLGNLSEVSVQSWVPEYLLRPEMPLMESSIQDSSSTEAAEGTPETQPVIKIAPPKEQLEPKTEPVEEKPTPQEKKTPPSTTTPVVEKKEIPLPNPDRPPLVTSMKADELKEIWGLVHDWAKAWSEKNRDSYLDFYAPEFTPPGEMPLENWKERIGKNFEALESIHVVVDNLEVFPQDQGMVQVSFVQSYRSDRYQDVSTKLLILIRHESKYKILGEVTTLMPEPGDTPIPEAYSVQILSAQEEESIKPMKEKMATHGFKPFLVTHKDDANTLWFALRIGRFKDVNQAKWLQLNLKRVLSVEGVIVPAMEERPHGKESKPDKSLKP